MAGIIEFLVTSAICLAVLYLLYIALLRKETFFRLSRFYLLVVMVLIIVIPAFEFSYPSGVSYSNQNDFVFLEHQIETVSANLSLQTDTESSNYILIRIVCLVYLAGVLYFLLRYVSDILKVYKIIKRNEVILEGNFRYVIMNEGVQPFSFMAYIFVSKKEYMNRFNSSIVFHEQEHVKQKHTIDLFILELLVVIQWFNPFMHLFRRSVKEVHEYLADNGVIKNGVESHTYMRQMLNCARRNVFMSLNSSFNNLLTKKRLKMITKNNSRKTALLKAGLILPVIGILIMVFAFKPSELILETDSAMAGVILKPDSGVNVPSIFPVKKENGVDVSSGYGKSIHPITKKERFHRGIDIKAKEGLEVYATANGTVKKAETGDGYGIFIIIDHAKAYSTLYAHLSKLNIKVGDNVKKGDVIGFIGSTGQSVGPHLHYEIKKNGKNVNPVEYIKD